MPFRLKAFAIHLATSLAALTLVLGLLYAGWYRWPGWYLAGMTAIVPVMLGVDLALGPLLTLVIASPVKPRAELARDLAVIVTVQLVALGYGSYTLWHGRPLYYAFSVDRIELVRASDIDPEDARLALKDNAPLAPHWYSRPRWIWAPLPDDPQAADRIMRSAIGGGIDVIDLPRQYRPWQAGVSALRAVLKPMAPMTTLGSADKDRLAKRFAAAGQDPASPNTVLVTGRNPSLLAVVDPATGRIVAIP